MRLTRVFILIAMICASGAFGAVGSAAAQEKVEDSQTRWYVFEPLRPPYSLMRIVKEMGAIQTGDAYTKRQMGITYEFRTHVNDGLAGCGDALADGTKAWFVATLDDSVHEVTFARDDNGAIVATPDKMMVGKFELAFKWGCFRDRVFLANIKGESAAGPEACRTPIPYGYCDLNGLIFWQLPDWDGDVAPTPQRSDVESDAEDTLPEKAAAVQEDAPAP